ncbi:MAG: DUF2071 domain-containing protein, partial [Rubricoccaceae bacterium]|nr:DUF2071 domain-containing protein [Rubricoccaceae bacterium]
NPLAVWTARRFFHLPYHRADMQVVLEGDTVSYETTRRNAPAETAFRANYRPNSTVYLAERGTLDHWLTERYCLYSANDAGALFRVDVHHEPWPLQHAEADIHKNTMLEPFGLAVPDEPPTLHFARKLEVVTWGLESLT